MTSNFADNRISREIKLTKDINILKSDLSNGIDWSKAKNMEFHEKKFESLRYRLLFMQDTLSSYALVLV